MYLYEMDDSRKRCVAPESRVNRPVRALDVGEIASLFMEYELSDASKVWLRRLNKVRNSRNY